VRHDRKGFLVHIKFVDQLRSNAKASSVDQELDRSVNFLKARGNPLNISALAKVGAHRLNFCAASCTKSSSRARKPLLVSRNKHE